MTTASAMPAITGIEDSATLETPHGRLQWHAVDDGYRCRIRASGRQLDLDCRLQDAVALVGPSGTAEGRQAAPDLTSACMAWLEWLFARHPELTHMAFTGDCVAAAGLPAEWHDGRRGLRRADFFQRPGPWYRGDNAGRYPLRWVENGQGLRHPQRPPLPEGELYRRRIHSLDMDFSIRRFDPGLDLDRLTRWMNDPRVAAFWEHAWPREEQAVYVDKVLADPHLDPVIGCFDDVPFGYFEVYWAVEDRLGPYYDAQPFDRGMHLLVGEPEYLGRRFTHAWLQSICHFMFLDDDRTQRLVGEPRADNTAMLKYLDKAPGWRKIREFDFPHKRAALVMCERADFFDQASFT